MNVIGSGGLSSMHQITSKSDKNDLVTIAFTPLAVGSSMTMTYIRLRPCHKKQHRFQNGSYFTKDGLVILIFYLISYYVTNKTTH